MMYRVSGALVASIGAVTLLLAANAAVARSGAAVHAGFTPAHPHAVSRPAIAHALRHRRRNGNGVDGFWPGWGDYSYGPSGEPVPDNAQAAVPDLRATCTYDIPWDWVHRCPPTVAPSEKASAPSCPTEVMKFPGRDGTEQTVNITRCY